MTKYKANKNNNYDTYKYIDFIHGLVNNTLINYDEAENSVESKSK